MTAVDLSGWELAVAGLVIAVLFVAVYSKFTDPEPRRHRWSSR